MIIAPMNKPKGYVVSMYSEQEFSCNNMHVQERNDESLDLALEIASKIEPSVEFAVVVSAQKILNTYSLSQYYSRSRIKAEV